MVRTSRINLESMDRGVLERRAQFLVEEAMQRIGWTPVGTFGSLEATDMRVLLSVFFFSLLFFVLRSLKARSDPLCRSSQ